MKSQKKQYQQGWILKWAIIVFAIILILSYLGFDLKEFIDSELTQKNIGYIQESIYGFWDSYLKEYTTGFYENTKFFIDPLADNWKNPQNLNIENFNIPELKI